MIFVPQGAVYSTGMSGNCGMATFSPSNKTSKESPAMFNGIVFIANVQSKTSPFSTFFILDRFLVTQIKYFYDNVSQVWFKTFVTNVLVCLVIVFGNKMNDTDCQCGLFDG